MTTSQLDRMIPPEIRADRFCSWISRVAATPGVLHILEIGASSGAGSTEALVLGALRNPVRPVVHCLEISRPRFHALVERYRDHAFVHCYNCSSVPIEQFPDEAAIDAFRRRIWTRFRFIRRDTVLQWLRQDIEYLRRHGLSLYGIRLVRERHGIDCFDAVLIDGSEFSGPADLDEVYGARFLLLDDIMTYKNRDNYRRLLRDRDYALIARSRWLRNGFAIFERAPDARPVRSRADAR
ncbi:MAG: hypothetical protein WEF86_16675 [Gemmatimonadota bacterium]